ncbi:MAG: hypothetical protein ACK52H_15045, partial [Burkholderiales bacterium]
DWEMRSDRNSIAHITENRASLDDWEMRSDRNTAALQRGAAISLDDWEMRSDRNSPPNTSSNLSLWTALALSD